MNENRRLKTRVMRMGPIGSPRRWDMIMYGFRKHAAVIHRWNAKEQELHKQLGVVLCDAIQDRYGPGKPTFSLPRTKP